MVEQPLTSASVVQASSQQVSSQLGDEVVILNLQDGTYYSLDDIGALIWDHIQQPCSVEQLCAMVMAEYDVDAEQCAADVIALLDDMASVGMIEVQDVAATRVPELAAS